MMCGVNFFSFGSLVAQGAFYKSMGFMCQFPQFGFDCFVLSMCSAMGNIFIYRAIRLFGSIDFVIIMTFRQLAAFVLSYFIYDHIVTSKGIAGVSLVFIVTFWRMYYIRKKQFKDKTISFNMK